MTDIIIDDGKRVIGLKINMPAKLVLLALKSGAELECRINEEFASAEDDDSSAHYDLLAIVREYQKLLRKLERQEG